jgi:branched-chain amino acid aminotransferase
MLDTQGFVAECTGDNIFIVKNDVLATPSQGRLRGITRDTVIDLVSKHKVLWPKMSVFEGYITRHEVYNADECFLTGTAAEIIPVVKVDGRVIGDGKPGTYTRKMMELFHEITRQEGVKY